MSNPIKVLIFSILTFLTAFQAKSQVYSDLNDYGYKGNLQSITTKFYSNIKEERGRWAIQDSANSRTITNYFNQDGNFTRKTVTSRTGSYQLVYDYADKIKMGWKKIDSSGFVSEVGKYTYNHNDGFIETSFNTDGIKTFQSIYIFGKNKRTKTLEDIGYNEDDGISFHLFSTFYDDDIEGHLHKLVTVDKLSKKTENFEFIILEKDKHNNPLKILVKRNSKPIEIRKVTIKYN
jgi:hypothetical protein